MENIEILNTKLENISSNIKMLEERMAGLDKTTEEYANDVKLLNDLQQKQNDLLNTQQKEIKEVNEETKDEIKTVGDWAERFKELKAELKEGEQALKAMAEAGLTGSEEFRNLAARVGEIKDAMADASTVTKQYADDAMAIKDVIGVVQVGTAAYGAYSSALSMLGVKSESTEKILRRFAQVQQLMNSLATLQTSLTDKSSVAYRLYNTVLDKLNISKKAEVTTTQTSTATKTAETAATTGLAAAEGVATASTGALTAALHALKIALISTGIGAIVVLVGTLVANLIDLEKITKAVSEAFTWVKDKVTDAFHAVTDFLGITSEEERAAEKAAEAEKKREAALAAVEQQIAKTAGEALKSSAETIAKLNELQKVINDTSKSEDERVAAMKRANEESGKEIYNLKDTKKYLNGMDSSIKAYIDNMVAEAKAKAILTKLGELYIQQLQVEEHVRKNGAGPWSRLMLETIKEGIAMYEKQLETISKSIKVYEDHSEVVKRDEETKRDEQKKTEDARKKAEDARKKADDEAKKRADELAKQKEKDMALVKKWGEAYDKLTAKQTKKGVENANYKAQLKQLEEAKKLELQYFEGTEQEKQKIIEKYNKQEEGLDAIHWKTMAQIGIEEAQASYEQRVTAIEMKKQQDELAFRAETNQILLQREAEYEQAKEWQRAELEVKWQAEDMARQEQLWNNRIEIAKQKQQELDEELKQLKETYGEDVEELDEYQELLEERNEQNMEIAEMEQDFQDELTDMQAEGSRMRNELAKKEKQNAMKIYNALSKSVTGLLGAIADANDEKIDRLKEGNEEEQAQARDLWEKNKKIRITAATIDMLNGAVTAYAQAQSLGPIAGPIVGGINAAAVITTGMMNISKIKNEKWDGDSAGGGSTGGTSVQFVPEASPLLDENYDMQRMVTTTTADEQGDVRVYVTEQDITNTQNKVEVREQNSSY